MREALEIAKKAICNHARAYHTCDSLALESSTINANCGDILCAHRDLCDAKTAIQKALASPPRACDLMTEEELSRVVSRSIVASVSSRPELNEEWIKSLVGAAVTAAIKCAYDTQLKSSKESNNYD